MSQQGTGARGAMQSRGKDAQAGRATEAARQLRAAVSLREQGDLTEALQALARLVQASPAAVWPAIELARTQAAAGLYRESAKTIGRTVEDNPGHRGAWAAMLGLTAAEARFDLALALVDRALGVFQEDRDFLAERGRYFMRLGDTKAARETLSRLQATHAGQETALRFEAQLLLRDDADRAAALLAPLRLSAPASPQVWALSIEAARACQDLSQATALCEEARQRWPEAAWIAVAEARTLTARQGPAAARERFRDLPPQAPVLVWQGHAQMQLGRYDAAAGSFDRALEKQPMGPGAVCARMRVALILGDHDATAEALLSEIAKQEAAGHRNAARLRLEIARIRGPWPDVLQQSLALLDVQGADAEVQIHAARAQFAQGAPAAALAYVDLVLERDPLHPEAARLRRELLLSLGRWDAYETALQARRPGSAGVAAELDHLRNLHHLGRHEEARLRLHAIVESGTGKGNASLGMELLASGERALADAFMGRSGGIEEEVRQEVSCGPKLRLDRIFDFEDRAPLPGEAIAPEGLLAWQLSRDRYLGRAEWLRRAGRATAGYAHLVRQHAPTDEILPWLHAGVLDTFRDLPAPAMLLTSHNGPLVFSAMADCRDDLHLLAARSYLNAPTHDTVPYTSMVIDHRAAAADMARALRAGKLLVCAHDLPARLARRGRGGAEARGKLFGQTVGLLDTVPKLVRAYNVPSISLLAYWRDGRIDVDLTRLPLPLADEGEQDWLDRWAQAYLDRIAWQMGLGPENMNLQAPLWRHLLLMAPGRN